MGNKKDSETYLLALQSQPSSSNGSTKKHFFARPSMIRTTILRENCCDQGHGDDLFAALATLQVRFE